MRIQIVEEVPTQEWLIQGTMYDSPTAAKFAAAKLFCNVTGVVVKRFKGKWTLFFWRKK